MKHMALHDKNRPKLYKYQRCGLSTDVKFNYQSHLKFHERQDKKYAAMKNPLNCQICYRMLPHKESLTKHMPVVHPENLYQCDLCGNYLKTPKATIGHIKSHLKN